MEGLKLSQQQMLNIKMFSQQLSPVLIARFRLIFLFCPMLQIKSKVKSSCTSFLNFVFAMSVFQCSRLLLRQATGNGISGYIYVIIFFPPLSIFQKGKKGYICSSITGKTTKLFDSKQVCKGDNKLF